MRTPRTALLAAPLLSGLLVLGLAAPAGAHGDTIKFKIGGQQQGHAQAAASWANDGDAVDEAVSATLSAVSADGRTVGPWRLIPVQGGTGMYTTSEALPAGQWKVTVESAFPSLGRGEGDLTVEAASGASAPAVAGPSAPAADSAVASAAAPAADSASAQPGAPAAAKAAAPSVSAAPSAEAQSSGGSAGDWILAGVAAAAGLAGAVAIIAAMRARRRSAG
ncbi:hypothetical protein [Kitasatospora sp. NPDC050543]|uniref:hypothetical protein n=1 Tax=Kitasatospora sp. NPDC050543 TaxID=3364054 RepID=UPI0037A0B33D